MASGVRMSITRLEYGGKGSWEHRARAVPTLHPHPTPPNPHPHPPPHTTTNPPNTNPHPTPLKPHFDPSLPLQSFPSPLPSPPLSSFPLLFTPLLPLHYLAAQGDNLKIGDIVNLSRNI